MLYSNYLTCEYGPIAGGAVGQTMASRVISILFLSLDVNKRLWLAELTVSKVVKKKIRAQNNAAPINIDVFARLLIETHCNFQLTEFALNDLIHFKS